MCNKGYRDFMNHREGEGQKRLYDNNMKVNRMKKKSCLCVGLDVESEVRASRTIMVERFLV